MIIEVQKSLNGVSCASFLTPGILCSPIPHFPNKDLEPSHASILSEYPAPAGPSGKAFYAILLLLVPDPLHAYAGAFVAR